MFKQLTIGAFILIFLAAAILPAQTTAILRGTVTDDSGAVIPGAAVRITGNRIDKTVSTGIDGSYSIPGLPPGRYNVRASFAGFTTVELPVALAAGRTQDLPFQLRVSLEKQEVTVKADAVPTVSTEPDNNAGALILRG